MKQIEPTLSPFERKERKRRKEIGRRRCVPPRFFFSLVSACFLVVAVVGARVGGSCFLYLFHFFSMGGKKIQHHTSKSLANKVKAATENKGGGKAGKAALAG